MDLFKSELAIAFSISCIADLSQGDIINILGSGTDITYLIYWLEFHNNQLLFCLAFVH